jgi:hypothetical protein
MRKIPVIGQGETWTTAAAAPVVYEFAEFRLLVAQRQLLSRTDGRPIDLTQKACFGSRLKCSQSQ